MALWKEMTKPVSLEEHAGETVKPTARPHRATDVTESVTVEGTRPPGQGDDWEVRAYFTNPGHFGGYYAAPLPAAHTGFKVYRGGQFQYSLDAGPTLGEGGGLGNLRFQGDKSDLEKNNAGIGSLGEVRIAPPPGMSGENFARKMAHSAQ